jgi:hypothetical protein
MSNVDTVIEVLLTVLEGLCERRHRASWVNQPQPTVMQSDGYGRATTLYTCKVCGRSWWEAATIEPDSRRR